MKSKAKTSKVKSGALKKPDAEAKPLEPTKEQKAKHAACLANLPSANAGAIIADYAKPFGEQSVDALVLSLQGRMKTVNNGDLQECEDMLVGQAHALQSMFMNLSRRAINAEYMKNLDAYLRLALKAQSQCRVTLETLAELKYPKQATFVKQQTNIANQQQVNNNGMTKTALTDNYAPACARTEDLKNSQNKLLEATHGQPL